ncbi:MAG: M16 family metallopeptidase [Gemmatimonadota bacterium]
MSTLRTWFPLVLTLALAATARAQEGSLDIPVDYRKLDNGLKVVLSPDTTAPIATVAVYYNIGFRIEPRDRTGFAHLFEHMMFQGSKNLGKMEFINLVQTNGGVLNGSTRFDYTNYFEIVPAHTLETMLWAEADRMRGLAITQAELTNQQGVVKNEVRVNVLNRPYGGFPWLDMPQIANRNWYNAHNFYGELEDLDAATLEDVQSFFDTYYAPNNAALVIVGDFEPEQAMAWVEEYFGDIPSADVPALPDLSEPRQEEEIRVQKVDSLATRPALAFAYHVPERNTPEWYAMGLLDLILLRGDDALLHEALVRERGMTGSVSGGINVGLGNMYNYNGPMLWTASLFHDAGTSADAILAVVDSVVEDVRTTPVDAETLERARIKGRSLLYDTTARFFGFGRADLLAAFALFDDNPARINELEAEFAKVTPELLLATAEEFLRPTNRSVLEIVPGAAAPTAAAPAGR